MSLNAAVQITVCKVSKRQREVQAIKFNSLVIVVYVLLLFSGTSSKRLHQFFTLWHLHEVKMIPVTSGQKNKKQQHLMFYNLFRKK